MHIKADVHTIANIMEDNDHLAEENRDYFREHRIAAFNFMSAPGAGKTTLLTTTIQRLKNKYEATVLVGDMVSNIDADRFKNNTIEAHQISTGKSCHLDAAMIASSIDNHLIPDSRVLFIENVGNLVCPAEFDLGEKRRIVLLSVTEGDDKPIKYPVIFQNCDAVLLTKYDLLDYVDFDTRKFVKTINSINPGAALLTVSAKTGSGFDGWIQWLGNQIEALKEEFQTQSKG